MRLLAAPLAALLVAGLAAPAAATNGNHLRFIYIKPGNPAFPDTQTINFGAKTLVGHGGSPMAYASPQLLNSSRCLAITGEFDKDSNVVTIFQLDDRNLLVPKNGGAAYGAAWVSTATLAAGTPYTVNVEERFYVDGVCTASATGPSTIITVPIIPLAAHIRENTSLANGCLLNCANTNADAPSVAWQGGKLLGVGSAICGGDTVYLRDAGPGPAGTGRYGAFNPHAQDYRIKPPATPYGCGSGPVTLTSETWDTGNDANGNPALKNGFQFGGKLQVDPGTMGNIDVPLVFDHTWCLANFGTPSLCYGFTSSTVGGGISVTNTRCEGISNETTFGAGTTCLGTARPDYTFSHNHIVLGGKALQSAGGATVEWNICEQSRNDCIDIEKGNNVVRYNHAFDWHGIAPNHGDLVQWISVTDGLSYSGNVVDYNTNVLGDTSFMVALFNAQKLTNTLTGSITGSVLTVTAITGDPLSKGFLLTGAGIAENTQLTTLGQGGTGTGGLGTYNLSVIQAAPVPSETIAGAICASTTKNCPDPPQNIFSNVGSTPGRMVDAEFKDNLYVGVTQHGLDLAAFDRPVVSGFGSILQVSAWPSGTGTTLNPQFNINSSAGRGGDGLTITNSTFMGYAYANQTGTLTFSPTTPHTIATTGYAVALPSLVSGQNPGYKTRAQVIAQATPANVSVASGGLVEDGTHGAAAGTVDWLILPLTNGGERCWNQPGLVFDATKTCVQMGTTPAT